MAAGKNRGIQDWRTKAVFGRLLLTAAAAFISRGTLSVNLALFICLAVLHKSFFAQARVFVRTPFLLGLSLLFLIPFVSGLWSSDIEQWANVLRLKLPLFFLPLAFAGKPPLSAKQWRMLALFFLLLIFGGCVWGLLDYAQHAAQIHEDYLRAKTICTPFENDHVRFSWAVSVAVIVCLLLRREAAQKTQKVLLLLLAGFFAVYLHMLAARTGLLSLYLFLFIYATALLTKAQNRKRPVLLLCALLLAPLLAYVLLPTFKARLRYNLYDLSFVRKAEYLPGSSDGARTMSLKAGWQVLKKNPFGAGAGDLMHEAGKWYAANVPQVLPSDKFYPCSEWLAYGGFAGWPGVILFTVLMFLPFFAKHVRHRVYWTGFHATAAISFLFDIGLENQYGIFCTHFLRVCFGRALRT